MIGRRAEARNWRRAERANLAEVERAPCLAQEQVGAEWKQRSDWKRQASGGGSHSHWGAPAPGVHPIFFQSISQVQDSRCIDGSGLLLRSVSRPYKCRHGTNRSYPVKFQLVAYVLLLIPHTTMRVRRQSTDRWIYIRPYVSGLVVRYTYNTCFSVSYIWSIFLLYCWN